MDKGKLEAVVIASDPSRDGGHSASPCCNNIHFQKDPTNSHTTWYGTDGHLLFIVDTDNRAMVTELEAGSVDSRQFSVALKLYAKNQIVNMIVEGDTLKTPSASYPIDIIPNTEALDKIKSVIPPEGEPFIALATAVLDKLVKALKKADRDYVYFTSESKELDRPLRFHTDTDNGGLRGVIMPCRWQ